MSVFRFTNCETVRQKVVLRNYRTVRIAFAIMCVALLSSNSLFAANYQIDIQAPREFHTLNVYPGSVSGDGWNNVNTLYEQDVSEDALFQDFSSQNSASPHVLTVREVEPPPYVDDEPNLEGNFDSVSPQREVENPSSSDIPHVDPPDSGVQLVPVPDSDESVSAIDGFFGIFTRVYELLPFAQESITLEHTDEPATQDESPEEVPLEVEPEVSNTEIGVGGDTAIPLPYEGFGETDSAGSNSAIEAHDTDESSTTEDFGTENNANEDIPLQPGEEQLIITEEHEDKLVSDSSSLHFKDFGLPSLAPGQLLENVQLRLSLGARVENREGEQPELSIEYKLGDDWTEVGVVVLDEEITNALNGGYFLFALPEIYDIDLLNTLEIRMTIREPLRGDDTLFVDALWIEVDTERLDRDILSERLNPELFFELSLPKMHELLTDTLDFVRTENPEFVLRYESQRNVFVNFFRGIFSDTLATVESVVLIRKDGGVLDVKPHIDTTPEGLWTIVFDPKDTEKLQPGTYTVQLTIAEGGKTFVDTLDFQWGVLAINPNQTEYALGDSAYISLAALSQNGNTICDAQLVFYVIDPLERISRVPVIESGLCSGNNVIDAPDYYALFTPRATGTYEMYVEHQGAQGEVLSHTEDTFMVVDSHPLWIERDGPTRIYPPALYPMTITVTAGEAFNGILTEQVPGNFTITDTDAHVEEVDGTLELSWNVDLEPGTSQHFSYSFDAPDISPYLYTLGPAKLRTPESDIVVEETPPTVSEPLLNETIVTTEESEVEEIVEPPEETEVITSDTPLPDSFVQNDAIEPTVVETHDPVFVQEENTEPGIIESVMDALFGDDENGDEAPDVSTESAASPVEVKEPGIIESIIDTLFGSNDKVDNVAPSDVITVPTQPVVQKAEEGDSVFSEHRKWQIASDATGSMLLYWASTTIPTGWTCVSCQVTDVFYQRFVMGSSTPGVNGGAATHSHTASGATGVTGATGVSSLGGGGADGSVLAHGHTYTPTISTDSNLPPYRQLVLIQHNSAGSPASIPTNAIALFDATVPSGWTQYAPQNGNYIRSESTTTIGTTGGALTHTHTISGTTGASDTNTNAPGFAGVAVATNGHTHTVSTTTIALNHEPLYRETILGKLTATSTPTDAMIAMWTDTPPTGWNTVSSTSEPFANRFVKASTTYGGVGGAPTSTHSNISNIVSSGPSATVNRTAGGTSDAPAGHTHPVSVTSFVAASNTPPYRTAIFAKRGPGGSAPDAPTLHVLFDYEKTGTSTPQFEFTGDDPDGSDTLVYQFEWDDDKDLDTSPTGSRTSDNETGCSPNCFTNTASSTDTSPFTDNERIRFTIQSGLTTGTTYYWRARVKETIGDTWSSWSTIQSFTYESGVSLSEWFQTEGTQFDGGTRLNTSTTTGAVTMTATTTQVPVVDSNWTSNTAAASASLVLTRPGNIEVGDLLLILVGNDNNTATAQWDDISLRPTGFTMINEAGNNTPDTHVAAFYRVADGTETATTSVPSQGTNNFWGFYLRVTGASTTNPINGFGNDYAVNNLTDHPVPSVTTTASNTLAFYMLAGDAVGTAPFSVTGAGWSESAEITINTGGTWGTRSMVSPGASGVATVTMSASDGASAFQFAVNPSLPFGTIMSPEVDFDIVEGQTTWGEIDMSTTEGAGTDTKVRVYYSSTTACDTLVPDSVLSGNSTGFDVSVAPVSIANLSTTTYNRICLKSTLELGSGSISPTLDDWMVRWVRTSQFTQTDYKWYANASTITPTDAWPVGAEDLGENEAIESNVAVMINDVLRLRMSLTATSSAVATNSVAFMLQYGEGTDCTLITDWYALGDIGSTTALWRGYDNSVTDGVTVSSTLLTSSEIRESYEEQNNTQTNPGGIAIGGVAEWDWALQNNLGVPGGTYCFRMTRTDGSGLYGYTNYPTLVTNASPNTLRLYAPFDNEKVASTSPYFEFDGLDDESDDISYQIQIDDDYTFGSVNVDRNTISHQTQFENLITPSDKDPYTNGERIRFSLPLLDALTNGTTYYWRVRGEDPDGSAEWGEWSTVYSFTIDTTVIVSTWFQTTEEQFDTDTHDGTDATASDLIQLASGSTTGTTTSSAINFTDGTLGNAWDSLLWTDNETSGDIAYRIEYYDSATESWIFVPEADLPGNSVGFDTSPVSLLDLNVETYEIIRIIAVLGSGSPTLSDWTVSWGYRIETPTNNAPFRNEKVATTTPTFEFYTTDPQADELVYEIQWSASSTFAASTTHNSASSTGFANITSGGGDTSPFISGDTIQFTIQPGDELTDGRTYWWRVRARDPLGTNQFSFYTDEQSFTVASGTTVSTWFQTTAEQFNSNTLSGAVTEGTSSVTIATTSTESLIGYAEGSLSTPRYRIWDGSSWGTEQTALDVGAAIGWVVTKASPGGNEYIMATMGTDADVNVQVYANGVWDNLVEITTSIPNTNMRGFDVAYEQSSGDALAVTCDGDSVASYWVWDGTAWTSGGSVGSVLSNTCGWVKLISDPTSDEIIAVIRDTGGVRYEARVWDGGTWGNSTTLGSMSQVTHEGIAAEYEDSGGQAVVVTSNGTAAATAYAWRAWDGASWTATATVALGDDFEAGTMARDDGTDNMAFCYVDEDGDVGVQRWTGAGFATGTTEFSTSWATAGNIYNDRPVDCIFEVGGTRDGFITGVFSTTTAVASSTWTGAAWSTNSKISTLGNSGVRIQLRRTGDGLIQAVSYATTTDRYEYADWNGTTWSAVQVLETDGAAGATPYKEPFMIAPKNPVTSGTVVGDPLGIDFYAGSGPYWQQMSWTDTESGGSSILYQVEYYDGDSWELIPNSLVPGNSTGTTTSPINLTNVLPVATYNLIRPVANMTCNLGTCPVLFDWTITWSAGITISGTADAYDETTDLTSGTVAVALNGVLQTGKTGTISGGIWSISNVNATPGDIVTVFINGANEVNEAVAVARYDGVGDMSGMRLFERHLALGSNDATTTAFTNAQIGSYDYPNDEDIFFSATGTTLDLCVDVSCGDSELYVMASTTYRPTGIADLNYFENNGTTTLDGNTIYVGRSWDNNATVTAGTSTVVFTATSTDETINETGAISPSFYNLSFGTTTGTATWGASTSLDINNVLTLTRGTLNRGTTTLTIGGNFILEANSTITGMGTTTFDGSGTSVLTDNTAALQNIGRTLIDGTSKTVQLGNNSKMQSLTIGADDIFDVSSSNWGLTIFHNFINNNTFVARSGTTTFSGTTTNLVITAGGDAFSNLAFNGAGGSWSFTESALSVDNDFTIGTGTVTLPSGTTTIAGSFVNATGTFAHNNGTVVMTTSGSKAVRQAGTAFTNAFYNLRFDGTGNWTFVEALATTSNDFRIAQGTVTFPSGTLTVVGNFENTAGTFAPNSGTVKFSGTQPKSITTNSAFYNLLFTRSTTSTFITSNVTLTEDLTVSSGTVLFPSGTFTIGGSITNTGAITPNSGTVLLNSVDSGETVSLGSSALNNLTVNSATGGWTITGDATTTGTTTLTSVGQFTVNPGATFAAGAAFLHAANGASTTWAGATLSLESGAYAVNQKTNSLEVYGTLRVKANTDIHIWNATATTYQIDSTGSLYSQDHNAVDGSLYVFGDYTRTSGTEYWDYGTDFDGTALLASTSRQVNVRFASGTTALISSSTLSVVGTTTGSTTIQNQGSGTYELTVLHGTTTASFYDFANLSSTGLFLGSSTRVTTLSDGQFTLGTASGTVLRISSTTIDANPALQIHRVNFSTSTGVTGRNVTQNDGTPASYWWFRSTLGSIAGESFDNDTGNPGSIRWDDSSLAITVSGTVYSDDGVTPMGSPTCDDITPNVRVVVNASTSAYSAACSQVDGTYTVNNVTFTGDAVLTTYLNTNGGEVGTVVTKTPTGNVTNHNIYANRIITKHQDVLPLTIADMAGYDSNDDNDIRFTAATGTTDSLIVEANTELHIASSTTFAPGGAVTINGNASSTSQDGSLHIDDYATFTGAGTTTYTIGGSLTLDTGSTFIPASTTIVMNATTTGKAITADPGVMLTVNELQFTGVGGGWNVNSNATATQNIYIATGTVTGTGNLTLTNGSLYGDGLLSLGSGTTTLVRANVLGGSQAWTFGNLVLGTGSVTGTTSKATTATTTVLGRLTIGTGHFFNAFGSVVDLQGAGTVFVENGTFIESTSTVRYSGTSGSSVISTGYYNLRLSALGFSPTFTGVGSGLIVANALVIGGAGTTTFTLDTSDPALDVNGSVVITTNGTLVGSNSGSFIVGGSWDNNGTFTGSGGTVTFDGSGTHTIEAGASAFSSVSINGTGDFTISEHATSTSAFTISLANDFHLGSGVSLAVGGTFTNALGGSDTEWTNSVLYLYGGGNYQINASTTNDVYGTLSLGASTQIRMWNSSAPTTDLSQTASLYSQDHGGVDGELYVYGAYTKTTGTDYWNYGTDFDGTSLTGGGERQVDVHIAGGGSVLYTGGGLGVVGTGVATTTVANQGSGTYGIRIAGTASTSMSYYDYDNLDANGLTFSGTPNVVTLSNGEFTVGVASGTAMTVGGTVINQNPARTFTGNSFGTSTGGLAFNVTATGTTASSWRFTNHGGVIDGEVYDVDPDGDPGYIVWDDSAASLAFSGHVYSDEGSTVSGVCDGSTNITLRIAGLTTYTTSCAGGTGLYSFSGITYSPGDSFVIYIDGEIEKAAVVSEDPVTSIANLDLYENRVIVRHEGSDPLGIADMALWDSSDDADLPFTAVDAGTDTLTLPANTKLLVWTGKEFEPNGNMTLSGGGGGGAHDGTLELKDNAIFDATGSETHSIGGSLVMGSGASLDDETSTFTFTTTGAGRTIDTNEYSFYNLTLSGSGSWTVANTNLEVGGDLTITQGALTLPASTSTFMGSLVNSGGSFVQNGGSVYFAGPGTKTVRTGTSAFGTTTFGGSGTWTYQGTNATTTGNFTIASGTVNSATGTLTVGGNFENRGTFVHQSGTLRMISSLSSTTINASTSDLGSVTIAGTGTFLFTDPTEALAGSLTLLSGTTTLPTTTISIAGSLLSQGGAFIHATGTVLFNSSDTGELITPGASTFMNLTIAAPAGGYTITESATTTGNFSLTSATSFVLQSGRSLGILGVFTNLVGGGATTWTGSTLNILSGANYTVNTKAVGGDSYNTIVLGNNTDLRLWNSQATTSLSDSLSSLYSQDNGGVDGELYIYGNYTRTTGADYWSATADFDGSAISARTVNVRHQANATSSFSGGTLDIIGTPTATTTITNQGSGTYALLISGGTLNAQYYAIRNPNIYGLALSGTTTITSLSQGDYELAVSGGALITVSSTTLNYNASAVFTGMRFATTTAITGVNVAVVGTTSSAWTLTSHRGNLAGESFDSDGVDACGSVRWDDSSCLLTQQSGYRWRNDDGGEGVPDSEWYDTSWSKRKRVTITNLDATDYTNAVVEVTVPFDSDMQTDFDDLRVTNSTGTTSLDFTRETYTASTQATLWVEVPSLPASESTEVYVYYGNGAATYSGIGTTTFIAYDDYEDGANTEYSGDTSKFVVNGSVVHQGSYGLKANTVTDRTTDGIYRTNASSTVTQGETIRFMEYIDSSGTLDEACTMFGVQVANQNQNYAVCLEQVSGPDRVSISKDVDDNDQSGTILASTTIAYSAGWYEVEVDWDTDDSIDVSVYKNESLVATTSTTDSSYTTGGFGYTYWFQHGGWDYFTARPLLTTEPTTTLGFEQVRGGASWTAGENTLASGISVGTTIRPRFVIENTGLSVSDAYQLMYASKGVSPSCEAVSSGSYTAVPVQASCAGSPVCMQTSTHFTNNASTTDVIGGDGVFTEGKIIEDPSNTTQSLSLDSNYYTEIEYAITLTASATSPSYCFRVSDNGASIDSYTRVAELGLIFAPNISSITFNNGDDIVLSPGATTTIYATGTVSDQNGYTDIAYATTTMFRSGVGSSCTADTNNCYVSGPSLCTYSSCSGDSCEITCRADFYYFADPTDTGSTYDAQSWGGMLSISDSSGLTATQTAAYVDLLTLRALNADSAINYGSLEVNSNTGSYNATTTFTNIGNDSIDVAIEGTNLTYGSSSTIPVSEQIYATSTFSYSACVFCSQLTASSTTYELDLTKPTTTTPGVTDQVYWGIEIPYGVSANTHQGVNTFYATGD